MGRIKENRDKDGKCLQMGSGTGEDTGEGKDGDETEIKEKEVQTQVVYRVVKVLLYIKIATELQILFLIWRLNLSPACPVLPFMPEREEPRVVRAGNGSV